MGSETTYSKGKKFLVEVELLEDMPQDDLLYILYQGKPIPASAMKLSIVYTQTIEEIKKTFITAATEAIQRL